MNLIVKSESKAFFVLFLSFNNFNFNFKACFLYSLSNISSKKAFIIIHGYKSNGLAKWLIQIKDNLLLQVILIACESKICKALFYLLFI